MFHKPTGQSSILLLLDFDGTLSEIADSPEEAVLRPGNAALLDSLARHPKCTVGVVSGRALDDVSRKVGVPGLVYAGNHGLEIIGSGLQYLHPHVEAALPAIAQAARRLDSALANVPGAFVENKTLTLTVHFRQTPAEYHDAVTSIFHDAAQPLVSDGLCRVTTAKSALELRPAVDWDKGRALTLIRSRLAPGAFPLYIGDDTTDEDAFRAAQAAGGAGVFVGPVDVDTRAHWRLDTPAAVSAALASLRGGLQPQAETNQRRGVAGIWPANPSP